MSRKPKTLSSLFALAAKRIESGRQLFICDAIGGCKTFPVDMRATAKEVIKERLHPHLYYTQWVRHNHSSAYSHSSVNGTFEKDKREGRIAWCMALAEEFKEVA